MNNFDNAFDKFILRDDMTIKEIFKAGWDALACQVPPKPVPNTREQVIYHLTRRFSDEWPTCEPEVFDSNGRVIYPGWAWHIGTDNLYLEHQWQNEVIEKHDVFQTPCEPVPITREQVIEWCKGKEWPSIHQTHMAPTTPPGWIWHCATLYPIQPDSDRVVLRCACDPTMPDVHRPSSTVPLAREQVLEDAAIYLHDWPQPNFKPVTRYQGDRKSVV